MIGNVLLAMLLEQAENENKALTEASKKEDADNNNDTQSEDNTEDVNSDNNTEEKEEEGNDASSEEDTDSKNNENEDNTEEDSNSDEDENNKDEENSEENPDDQNTDDFNFDMNADDGEDTSPNPDGLPDPDDDGSNDVDDEEEETNIQTNILNLSSIDRAILSKRLFGSYQDLNTKINSLKNLIDNNETVIDPDVRDIASAKINDISRLLIDYMKYKYSLNNYEDNMNMYLLFAKNLDSIIKFVDENIDNKR